MNIGVKSGIDKQSSNFNFALKTVQKTMENHLAKFPKNSHINSDTKEKENFGEPLQESGK